MVTSDTPSDKVSGLLISWFTERTITDMFCMFAKFCLQMGCHLWHHRCNDPTPNMHVLHVLLIVYTLQMVVSCPGKWKILKYGNRSMETEVWKRKYESEKKAVYWRLVPYWLATVPSQRARRLFFSLPYFCILTSVSALQHFLLVLSCPVCMFLGLLQLWLQSWHHSTNL